MGWCFQSQLKLRVVKSKYGNMARCVSTVRNASIFAKKYAVRWYGIRLFCNGTGTVRWYGTPQKLN